MKPIPRSELVPGRTYVMEWAGYPRTVVYRLRPEPWGPGCWSVTGMWIGLDTVPDATFFETQGASEAHEPHKLVEVGSTPTPAPTLPAVESVNPKAAPPDEAQANAGGGVVTSNWWIVEAARRGYTVTDSGDVISPHGRKLNPRKVEGGYKRFRICRECPPISVHRLQAFQKFGHAMFAPGIEVRHLDGNAANNHAYNIAIGTKSQNAMDKLPEVRRRTAFHASRHVIKHSHADILAYLNSGHTYKQAMAKFGIKSKGTLSFIARKSIESRLLNHATLTHARSVADLYDDNIVPEDAI